MKRLALVVILGLGSIGCGTMGVRFNAFESTPKVASWTDIVVVQRLLVQYKTDDRVFLKLTENPGLNWNPTRARMTIVAARATAVDLFAEEPTQ